MKKIIGFREKDDGTFEPIYKTDSIARPFFWLVMSLMGIAIILGWGNIK